ncbi:hypothetical protein BaRGS_00022643 [Batillaria attramentaria]|uniref:Uncharacterized protein n=1 Tax=Batillaria attramentaria TaxID=370345 RepID=A0ABD0KFS8_9CAEN
MESFASDRYNCSASTKACCKHDYNKHHSLQFLWSNLDLPATDLAGSREEDAGDTSVRRSLREFETLSSSPAECGCFPTSFAHRHAPF